MSDKIITLLHRRNTLCKQISTFPYDGTIEVKVVKGAKYIYIRKRMSNKITSTYVGKYTDDLYNLLLKNKDKLNKLKNDVKYINSQLKLLGYDIYKPISDNILLNIDYAKREHIQNIYNQAVLEGIDTSYDNIKAIVDDGQVTSMKIEDLIKIINLKNAWNFILNLDIIKHDSDYGLLSEINSYVNDNIYKSAGEIRTLPVKITGCEYFPQIPDLADVKVKIRDILSQEKEAIDIAIDLALFVMKTQVFDDGNKRTAILYANHYLISKGAGLLVVPYEKVKEFQNKLVDYYDDKNNEVVKFLKTSCYTKLF